MPSPGISRLRRTIHACWSGRTLHTSQPSAPNRFISLMASGVTSLPPIREGARFVRACIPIVPSLAPGLGATRVWPGQFPLVKSQRNWTHVGRTHRCPCAHEMMDAGGPNGRRTSIGLLRHIHGVRRVFQAQRPGRASEEHRGNFARRRSPPFPCSESARQR
jgi:hypothetical protein